jgi:ribosomal protein S18 acetylase RimI-like enzyme
MMSPAEFSAYHGPALAANEAKHSLILTVLSRLADTAPDSAVLYWSLGAPGACAAKSERHSILLGELDKRQCSELAEATSRLDYPGVVGPDLTAQWFAERAAGLGLRFFDPIRQQIHALSEPPRYPHGPGCSRLANANDAALLADWIFAFLREAVPRDPVPPRSELERRSGDGRHLFWVVDGQPVSMAAIVRQLSGTGAIGVVYTPPALRGPGYAGSVTAAAADRIFAEGRRTACLYADMGNPAANRCYAGIGFKAVCGSLHYHRRPEGGDETREK